MNILNNWHNIIMSEQKKSYFSNILKFILLERQSGKIIYPAEQDVFNAFFLLLFTMLKLLFLDKILTMGLIKLMGYLSL